MTTLFVLRMSIRLIPAFAAKFRDLRVRVRKEEVPQARNTGARRRAASISTSSLLSRSSGRITATACQCTKKIRALGRGAVLPAIIFCGGEFPPATACAWCA